MIVRSRTFLCASLLLAAVEVFIASCVHDRWVRPYGGDVLAVVLLYTSFQACHRGAPGRRLVLALALSFAVEFAQYAGIVARLGLAQHAVARTLIGTHFDWADIAAYCVGAIAVVLAHRVHARVSSPNGR